MDRSVALVYPYFRTSAPVQELFAPLGIASLASQAQALGVRTMQYDCTFAAFDDVVDRIAAQQPALVGIYVMVTLSASALRLLSVLRERLPDTLFVAGGPLPTVYPGRFARRFDVVFRGESDVTFPRFCRDYLALGGGGDFPERLDLGRYGGIYVRTADGVVQADPIHHAQAMLDSLPIPDRSGADHAQYQAFWHEKTGYKPATIMLTRGCPYACDFCSKPIFGNLLRQRALEHVMAEVADIERLGYDQLWIADDCFTLDAAYLHAFCRRLIAHGTGITWSCLSRVDGVTAETAGLMRQAGCVKVYLGLESGSDETLRLMNKRATVRDGVEAARLFHAAGMRVGAFFIVGYPGESVEAIERTFAHALALPLDEISFNVPFPLPGSALYARTQGVDTEADWEIENETRFVYSSEFDAAWLKERIAATLEQFRQRARQPSAPG